MQFKVGKIKPAKNIVARSVGVGLNNVLGVNYYSVGHLFALFPSRPVRAGWEIEKKVFLLGLYDQYSCWNLREKRFRKKLKHG